MTFCTTVNTLIVSQVEVDFFSERRSSRRWGEMPQEQNYYIEPMINHFALLKSRLGQGLFKNAEPISMSSVL